MQWYLGTSGWSYDWNRGNSLEWYREHSKFNAIELNMSYYRFPYPSMILSWKKKAADLVWVVKVHRSITHYRKLDTASYPIWERFRNLFSPLEPSIHFFLFQFPKSFIHIDRCEAFLDQFGSEKIAFEFRTESLFSEEILSWGDKHQVLTVSVDAPQLPRMVMSKKKVYLRFHGRSEWYAYDYSYDELREIKTRIEKNDPYTVYLFFNNHAMFSNAITMKKLLEQKQ